MKLSVFIFFVSLLTTTDSLYISACSGDRDAMELTENQPHQATCEGILKEQGITWWFAQDRPFFMLATCDSPNRPCYMVRPQLAYVTRGSTSSTLVLVNVSHILRPGADDEGLSTFDLFCQPTVGASSACPIDIAYTPSSSEVRCRVSPSTGWNVTVSCTVSKAYSARHRYRCDVRNSTENHSSTGTSLGVSSYSAGSISDYVNGTCTSSFIMPTSPSHYTYTVIVYPGVKPVSAFPSVIVALPNTDPTIRCNTPLGFVIKQAALACECTASDLGQPQGRLLVYRGNAHRVSGNYGDSSVRFGESSVSSADNNAVYRCVLDWATADREDRSTSFTLKVACGHIHNCPSHTLAVEENAPSFHLTCLDYCPPVRWEYKSPSSAPVFLGMCQASSCSLQYHFQSGYFRLVRLSSTSSRLHFKSAATARELQNFTYFCAGIPCRISIKLP